VAEEKKADSGKLLCASGSKGIKDGVSPSMNVCEGSVPNHGSLFAHTVLALPRIIISEIYITRDILTTNVIG